MLLAAVLILSSRSRSNLLNLDNEKDCNFVFGWTDHGDYKTYNRDSCYYNKGMSELNPEYCTNIKYAIDLEYRCLEHIAVEKEDGSFCELIRPSNFNYKRNCIEKVSSIGQ